MPETRNSSPQTTLLQYVPFVILAACILALAWQITVPYDIWWQLANGRQICETGRLVRTDTYTFTIAGEPYLNKYWAFEIMAFQLYKIAGWSGMTFLHVALIAGVAMSLWFTFRTAPRWAFLVLSIPALILLAQRSSLRGYLLSFIIIPPYCLAAHTALLGKTKHRWRILAVLIGLQVLWTNLHSEFLWGPFITGVFAVEAFWKAHRCRPKRLGELALPVAATIGVFAACLVNPFGISLPLGLIREAQLVGVHSVSSEWLPFARFAQPLGWISWILFVAMVGLSFRAPRGSFSGGRLLLFVFAAVTSLKSFRFIGLMVLVGFFVAMKNMEEDDRWRDVAWQSTIGILSSVVFAIFFWAVCTDRLYHWQKELKRFGSGIITSELPTDCSRFLRDQELRGNMLNDWSYGGYLIWHNGPDILVAEDGRTAPFSRDLSDTLQGILKGDGTFLESFEESYRVDGAVVPWTHGKFLNLLAGRSDWACLFVGMHSSVWMKKTSLEEQHKMHLILDEEGMKKLVIADAQSAFEDEPWLTFPTAVYRRALFFLATGQLGAARAQVDVLEVHAAGHPLLARLRTILANVEASSGR